VALIVQKFGGTSVGSLERIEQVADKVARFRRDGHDVVVVVSAMSGETNRLLGLAHEIQAQPVPRELDALLATGEQVTTALLAMALHKRGRPRKSYTARRCASSRTMHTPRRASARSTTGACTRTSRPATWWSWRASRVWTSTATSPRSGAAARIPRPSRWRRH
jgi:aspartokinase